MRRTARQKPGRHALIAGRCATLLAALLWLTACHHAPLLTADDVTATPTLLEVRGGRVPVVINGRIPEHFLRPDALLSLTPRLVYGGGLKQLEATPLQLRGSKREGDAQEISYATGGNFSLRTEFPYDSAMQQAELRLLPTLQVGRQAPTSLPPMSVAQGTVATSTLADRALRSLQGLQAMGRYQHRLLDGRNSALNRLLQEVNLRNSVLDKLSTEDFIRTLDDIDLDLLSTRMTPIPRSELYFKELIGQNDDGTHRLLSADNATVARLEAEAAADTTFTRADWSDLTYLLRACNLSARDSLLAALTTYVAPSERGERFKTFLARYGALLRAVIPRLKRSRSFAVYDITGYGEHELLQLGRERPEALGADDLLLCAALADDAPTQQACYEAAMRRDSTDYCAHNNLCCLSLAEGHFTAAEAYADEALQHSGSAPEPAVNKALLRLIAGDAAGAEHYLDAAGEADGAQLLRGVLALRRGDYAEATQRFSGSTSNMAALAQLLARDYQTAAKTLASILEPDATTDYLKAIVAARTGRPALAAENLRAALRAAPELIPYARRDAEFRRYSGEEAFQDLFATP